jgi:hypothetical protein
MLLVAVRNKAVQFFNRFSRYVNYRGRDAVDTEIKLLAPTATSASPWTTGDAIPPWPPDQAKP